MTRRTLLKAPAALLLASPAFGASRRTTVTIYGDRFLINGRPTYEGRTWRGHRIEGLLMNSRMVQGIFDDLNPATRDLWNTRTRSAGIRTGTRGNSSAPSAEWRRHGLLGLTLNLQGGSPQGYKAPAVAQQRLFA